MSADPVPNEMLLQHAGFLRNLARDLVGNAAAADDAVQDVWVRALERPPRHGSNLRGWLRVVMTNLVRSRARADSRRAVRELDRAGEVDSLSPSENEATLRSVTEAVLGLDEPLRGAVLQRYFQDLTVEQIAQRENVPVSTVKSRLQRALEVLRARLEREQRQDGRSWSSALYALLPPERALRWMSPAARAADAGKGVLLMTAKTKIAIGCVAALASWLCIQRLTTSSSARPSERVASSDSSAPATSSRETAPVQGPLIDDHAKSGARSVASRSAVGKAAAAIPARSQTLFYGTLLDPDGKPLHGLWYANVCLTDSTGRRRVCDAKDEGSFAFHALPVGKYSVEAGAYTYRKYEGVIEFESADAQIQQDFTLQPLPVLKIRVTTPEGEDLSDALQHQPGAKARTVLLAVATAEAPGKWFREVTGALNNPFGIGAFWNSGPLAEALPSGCMGALIVNRDLPAYVSLLNYHRVLQTKEAKPGDDEVRFVISVEEVVASCARIVAQVVDAETQAPLEGANAYLGGGTYLQMGLRSDAKGMIVFESREPGEFDLHVQPKGYEEYTTHFLADSGTTTDLGQIALGQGLRVDATVVDASGNPRSEKISLGILDPSTGVLNMERERIYQSAGDGVLRLTGLGRRVYVLRTRNHNAVNDQDGSEPKWVSGNYKLDLRSGVPPTDLVIKLKPATRLMLVVTGEPALGLSFRVTDEMGFELVSSHFDGNGARPLALPQGAYRVALLDGKGQILAERSVSLGGESVTVELAR